MRREEGEVEKVESGESKQTDKREEQKYLEEETEED